MNDWMLTWLTTIGIDPYQVMRTNDGDINVNKYVDFGFTERVKKLCLMQ